jgi:hypothetical protein
MSERLHQEVKNVDPALKADADDGSEDCLSASASPSAIAAPDFAVDYSGSDGLFSLVVRGVHARMPEVSQDFFQVPGHEFCQAMIMWLHVKETDRKGMTASLEGSQ